MSRRVIVVGAGVVGLTCAVRLAESTDLLVDVLARDLPGENASALGPVPWLPPPARLGPEAAAWARLTRERLGELAEGTASPETGVVLLPGRLVGDGSPDGGRGDVQRVTAPVIFPVAYLRYLVRRLLAAGGTLTRMSLPTLPQRGLVLNCSGLAARALAEDLQVLPWRWQYLRVTDPGLGEWTAGAGVSIVPDRGLLAIAADDEPGTDEPHPDGRSLLARAVRLEPRLAGVEVSAHRAALRAHRPGVQLSVRHEPERTVLHCYGHGSAGPSLSWGCAEEVVRRVSSLVTAPAAADTGLW